MSRLLPTLPEPQLSQCLLIQPQELLEKAELQLWGEEAEKKKPHLLCFYFKYELENKLKSESLSVKGVSFMVALPRAPRPPLQWLLYTKDSRDPARRVPERVLLFPTLLPAPMATYSSTPTPPTSPSNWLGSGFLPRDTPGCPQTGSCSRVTSAQLNWGVTPQYGPTGQHHWLLHSPRLTSHTRKAGEMGLTGGIPPQLYPGHSSTPCTEVLLPPSKQGWCPPACSPPRTHSAVRLCRQTHSSSEPEGTLHPPCTLQTPCQPPQQEPGCSFLEKKKIP